MLTIKRNVPFKKLSLIHFGLSARSYIAETVASLKRRLDAFREKHDYVGRKSIVGAGAVLLGFAGSIYVLLALQPQAAPEVATPAAAQAAKRSPEMKADTPVTNGMTTEQSTAGQSGDAAPAAASSPAGGGSGVSPAQTPYVPAAAAPAPSLVAPQPVAAAPAPSTTPATSIQPGMGTTSPVSSPTPVPTVPAPTAPSPAPTTTSGPITTLQQTILPKSTQPLVSPVTNTVDNLLP